MNNNQADSSDQVEQSQQKLLTYRLSQSNKEKVIKAFPSLFNGGMPQQSLTYITAPTGNCISKTKET